MKIYESPVMEIVMLSFHDVLTGSLEQNVPGNDGNEGEEEFL